MSKNLDRIDYALHHAKEGIEGIRAADAKRGPVIRDAITALETTVAEVEQLRERLALAEAVCLMFGWSPSDMHGSDRTKATTMLWRRWADHQDVNTDPAAHPELSDAVIERLARERDEIRDRTAAKLREKGASGA